MNTNNTISLWRTRFAPLNEFEQEVRRLFDGSLAPSIDEGTESLNAEWRPSCDVEESEDHYLFTLDMPGVPKDQIKLEVADKKIAVSGERKQERKGKSGGAFYSERRYGKFHRSFTLPVGVDASKVEADYVDGALQVYLPKSEVAKPRQVKIGSGASSGFFGKFLGQNGAKEKGDRSETAERSSQSVVSFN